MADLHSEPLSFENLFFTILDLWWDRIKDFLTRILPDQLEKILIKNLEFAKNEFESQKVVREDLPWLFRYRI